MKRVSLALPLVFGMVVMGVALAASSPTVVMPGHETWQKPQMGASEAVLFGNPGKSGFYVVRLKVGPNWNFPVHYHPTQENVTVLSGTLYAGVGNTVDKSKAIAFPAGSFIAMPANVRHFAFTKGTGAVLQIDGMGPEKDIMAKK